LIAHQSTNLALIAHQSKNIGALSAWL